MGQAVVDGIFTGGLYAAYGIGLSLIFGVTRVISGVHGTLIVLGGFLAYTAWSAWSLDPFVAVPGLLVVGFAVGYLLQRSMINRVLRRNVLMTITVTFGIDLILTTVILVIWGADLRGVTLSYRAAGVSIFGVQFVYIRVGIFVGAVALALGLDWVMRKTEAGRRIRAVSQDRTAAELIGLNCNHYYGLAHGFAAAVALAAGAFLLLLQTIHPFEGVSILFVAFAVVVLAGFGSVAPVLVAGLVLGVASSIVGLLIGPQYEVLALFLVYLAVATFRPSGLFGKTYYGH